MTLSTTVPDPKHPDAPVTITDMQQAGEAILAFFARHDLNVSMLRTFLNNPSRGV